MSLGRGGNARKCAARAPDYVVSRQRALNAQIQLRSHQRLLALDLRLGCGLEALDQDLVLGLLLLQRRLLLRLGLRQCRLLLRLELLQLDVGLLAPLVGVVCCPAPSASWDRAGPAPPDWRP